ncbi:YczE/YyaS/YitT family protein [Paenibacillus turpanensis]|uniref:YczE/YyaS/YitT family protein n=1 Tax=Paenibacillus turpanensis TaxID=2689078 RepID=UPI001FB6CC6A|nr:YitT family protein [Paenibacillus turpanensis]
MKKKPELTQDHQQRSSGSDSSAIHSPSQRSLKGRLRINARSLLLYTGGILILTFGIALSIRANLGTGPFDALLVGLSSSVGLSVGSWELILGLLLIVLNAAALRRRPELAAAATALLTGIGIDLWLFLTEGWLQPQTLIGQALCFALSLPIGGLGIAIYLNSKVAPAPLDRSMLVVSQLTKLNVGLSRTLISVFLVVLAFVFHGPIGIGTLLAAVLSGPVLQWFMKRLQHVKAAADQPPMMGAP